MKKKESAEQKNIKDLVARQHVDREALKEQFRMQHAKVDQAESRAMRKLETDHTLEYFRLKEKYGHEIGPGPRAILKEVRPNAHRR